MARRMRLTRPLAAEVLRQLEALVLIAGGRVRAVEGIRRAGKLFVHQPPDRLAVLQQERHIAAAHFQHRPSGWAPISALPEAWIEEAGIMNAKLPIAGSIGAISAARSGGIWTLSREARM